MIEGAVTPIVQRQSQSNGFSQVNIIEEVPQFDEFSVDRLHDDKSSILTIPKHHMRIQQQQSMGRSPTNPLILLKPNGAPVFETIGSKAVSGTTSMVTTANQFYQQDSTMDETRIGTTVRAHSFVVGRAVSNQTTINLLTAESGPQPGEEKQFPIKVLYQKPALVNKETNQNKESKTPGSGFYKEVPSLQIPRQLKLKQNLKASKSKTRDTSNTKKQQESQPVQQKPIHEEYKISVRPKSAKVSSSIPKPAQKKKVQPVSNDLGNVKKNEETNETKPQSDIPFAENRHKGQFGNLTEDLFKKAQDALKLKKQEEKRKKKEIEFKKQKQREIEEQIKQANLELVSKQREKGLEHIDFRKKEEEAKEKARKDENKAERERQKELRELRKIEREKQLGLDMIDGESIQEYRRRVKETLAQKEREELENKAKVKGVIIAPLREEKRPQSSNPRFNKVQDADIQAKGQLAHVNSDLKQFLPIYKPTGPQNARQEDPDEKYFRELEEKKSRELILKEQKRKRREKELEEQLKAENERKRKAENMRQLEEQLHKQKLENLARLQELAKLKEEEKKRIKELEEAKKNERKTAKKNVPAHQEQMSELHEWIEQQMNKQSSPKKQEAEDEEALEQPARVTKVKVDSKQGAMLQKPSGDNITQQKMRPASISGTVMEQQKPSKQKGFERANEYAKDLQIGSYEIPGNSELDYQEFQKLGQRDNRYGIFGDNGYADAVEIKKRPAAVIEKVKQQPKPQSNIIDEVRLSNEGVLAAFKKIQEYHEQKYVAALSKDQVNDLSFSENQYQRQKETTVSQERRILNEIHKQYLLNFKNVEAEEAQPRSTNQLIVPGVVNIEAEIQKQKQESLKKQTKAVLVIQKWARGFYARKTVRKIRERKARDIDEEYGYFEHQVKFSKDYNLQKFIRDKQKLRDMTKTAAIAESDSIVERIGESSSQSTSKLNNAVSKSYGGAASQSMGPLRGTNKENVMVQNFFMQGTRPHQAVPPENDPFSIINLMVKRSMGSKLAAVQSPVKMDSIRQKQSSSTEINTKTKETKKQPKSPVKASHHHDHHHHAKRRSSHSSEIEEEIEGMEQESVSSSKKSSGSIEEDIIAAGASSESTSKEQLIKQSFQQLRDHKPFHYRMQSSLAESIQEDIVFSVDRKSSPLKKSGGSATLDRQDSSSIQEESQLQQASASRASSNKRNSGHIEESIHESVVSADGSNSNSSSAHVLPKKIQPASFLAQQKALQEAEKQKTLAQIKEFDDKIQGDRVKREQMVSELFGELNRYESAQVSTLVVERMEKIISKSLAQKDQLFLAQRMHELELERKHKEEIARIREEQMKLMAQLMLAGAGAPNNGQAMPENQRKEMMETLQKIIEKPIIIQQPAEQVPQVRKKSSLKLADQSINQSSSMIRESIQMDNIRESVNELESDDIEEQIPEEVTSQSQEDTSEEIKESMHYDNTFDESNNNLSKVRRVIGSEQEIRNQSKKVADGKGNKHASGIFEKHSFHDFTEEKFKQFLTQGSREIFAQLDSQLQSFKDRAYKEIESELKKELITPRTHKRKGEELEKWAQGKRGELQKKVDHMSKVTNSTILESLKKEKEIILEKIGISPRHPHRKQSQDDNSSSISYSEVEDMEDSKESDTTRNAREQIARLQKNKNDFDVSESNATLKAEMHIKKKKAIAKKLILEKERVIKENLKERKLKIEEGQAERMMSLALKLDPRKEVEVRYNNMRRAVEESSENLDSARFSQSGAPSESTNKKKVQFASPDKYRSAVASSHDSSSAASVKYSNQKGSSVIEDSIGESININESLGQSLASVKNPGNGPSSQSGTSSSNNNAIKQSSNTVQRPPSSIQESVHEQSSSQQYTEDFEQSQANTYRGANSTPNRKQLSSYDRQHSESGQIDEDYSQNFDESINQTASKIKEPSVKSTSQHPIVEALEEDEDQPVVSSQNAEEQVISGTLSFRDSSSKLPGEIDQHVQPATNVDKSAENKEHSSNEYSEDFHSHSDDKSKVEQQSSQEKDPIESLQSYNSEIESSQVDSRIADLITEEFLDILVNDIQESRDLILGEVHDEAQFKTKFPFNQEKEEELPPPPMIPTVKVETKKAMEDVKTVEDLAREKYEKDVKKLQDMFNANVRYLEMLIENINKQELIVSLERPIETDPLRKLAYIFSQDNGDSDLHNDTINASTLLSLNYFIEMEDEHQRRFGYDDVINNSNTPDPQTVSNKQELEKAQQSHRKALFDAFNQALDIERPYHDKGKPAPWSKQTRMVLKKVTESQVDQIMAKAKERVLSWCRTGAGTRLAPPPPPPPSNPDDPQQQQHQQQQQHMQTEEERVNALRETRLGLLMMKDLDENEMKWVDYEDEDTQVKFDLADMVLDVLASEVAGFLHVKSNFGRQ